MKNLLQAGSPPSEPIKLILKANETELVLGSDPREAGVGVAEAGEGNAGAVHQREIKAAQFAVLIALVGVVEDAPRRQRAAEAADGEEGNFAVIVLRAGPHI